MRSRGFPSGKPHSTDRVTLQRARHRPSSLACGAGNHARLSIYVGSTVPCRRSGPLRAQATTSSIQNSPGLQSVAELASAWSQVSRRLPAFAGPIDNSAGGSSSEAEALILAALKLALSTLHGAPPRPDGRQPLARAVDLAAVLADLSAAGIPLDAEAIAAGVVVEAVEFGGLDMRSIQERCGLGVASLVHDVLRIRSAALRVELYDDVAASAVREWCLAMHDVRANVLEMVSRWDDLQNMFRLPYSDQQIMALEALQLFAPLGHALGLGAVSSRVEDLCFKVLFPSSYTHTSEWLRDLVDIAENTLFTCQQQLLVALDDHPKFKQLAASVVIRARTKSLFSIMKKLLQLEDLSKGGRQKEEIFDVLGMRAVVQPRNDLPAAEAEELARQACYIVQEVAQQLWLQVPGRSKDYIAKPKRNGYQSIHMTMHLPRAPMPVAAAPCFDSRDATTGDAAVKNPAANGDGSAALLPKGMLPAMISNSTLKDDVDTAMPYVELQVRTLLMDELSEAGEASHASYKGGLDTRQARQLREWTEQLRRRLAMQPSGQLMLPAPGSSATVISRNGVSLESEDVALAAQALFSNWDLDGNGVISVEELREQLRELGAGVAEADAEALMSVLSEEEEFASSSTLSDGPLQEQGQRTARRERGITLDGFSKFVQKVSLVGAINRLDQQQAADLLQ